MALGEFKMFQMKSKRQREKEEREYAIWAFPYGELQKAKLTDLIKELNPKASIKLSLASFLTCKELFDKALEDTGSQEDAIYTMVNVIKNYNQLIKSDEMPMYLALVLADAEIEEKCEYPSADDMRIRIQELDDVKKANKRSIFKRNKEVMN